MMLVFKHMFPLSSPSCYFFLSSSLSSSCPVLFSIPTISFLLPVLQNRLDRTVSDAHLLLPSVCGAGRAVTAIHPGSGECGARREGIAGSEVEAMLSVSVLVFNLSIYFSRYQNSLEHSPSSWLCWSQVRKNHSAVRFTG